MGQDEELRKSGKRWQGVKVERKLGGQFTVLPTPTSTVATGCDQVRLGHHLTHTKMESSLDSAA